MKAQSWLTLMVLNAMFASLATMKLSAFTIGRSRESLV
jgi:hypothetical protein